MGVGMVDAPVAGGVPAAKAGSVTVMGSGPGAAWATAATVLRKISPKVYRCSDRVGDGQAMKLVNNAMGAGYRVSTLELAALGRKLGLGLGEISDRLNAGTAINFTTKGMLAALVEGRSTTDFSMALMVKDLNEALALAAGAGVPCPMVAAARSIMQTALNLLGSDAKLDDIIPTTEKLAAVSLTGPAVDGAEKLPDGETPESLAATIERAVDICTQVVVCEWVAVGAGFGLPTAAMAAVINAGSAWSSASERILPALAKGTEPVVPGSLGEMAATCAGSAVSPHSRGCRPGYPARPSRWWRPPGTSSAATRTPGSSPPTSPGRPDCQPGRRCRKWRPSGPDVRSSRASRGSRPPCTAAHRR